MFWTTLYHIISPEVSLYQHSLTLAQTLLFQVFGIDEERLGNFCGLVSKPINRRWEWRSPLHKKNEEGTRESHWRYGSEKKRVNISIAGRPKISLGEDFFWKEKLRAPEKSWVLSSSLFLPLGTELSSKGGGFIATPREKLELELSLKNFQVMTKRYWNPFWKVRLKFALIAWAQPKLH